MKISHAQWQGTRSRQEDSLAVRCYDNDALLLVGDGMGGHDAGDVASFTAVKVFQKAFDKAKKEAMPDRLRVALDQANDAVGRMLRKRKQYGGTTLAAAYVGRGILWWASVGDSPLFLWRHGHLVRLNEDHSMRPWLAESYRNGDMTYAQYVCERNYLNSAVTGDDIAQIDLPRTPYFLLPGDRIILGTDGLEPCLNAFQKPIDDVARILGADARDAAASLVAYLQMMGRPAYDNVTAIVADPF